MQETRIVRGDYEGPDLSETEFLWLLSGDQHFLVIAEATAKSASIARTK